MIVRMKRLALIVSQTDREDLLRELGRLGLVHVKESAAIPDGETGRAEEAVARTKKAIAALEGCRLPPAADKVIWGAQETAAKVEEIVSIAQEKEDLAKSMQYIEGRMELFRPWGGFDPADLKVMEANGVSVRLYRAPANAAGRILSERRDVHVISRDGQFAYLAVISETGAEHPALEEIRPPDESFESLFSRHEAFKKRAEEIDIALRQMARGKESLKKELGPLEKRRDFLKVLSGMGREKGLSYLEGYIPAGNAGDIKELSGRMGFGYLIQDPEGPEEVPTLIRNPRWVDIISPVFSFMQVVPGYKEYDISFPFLLFFSLFFAMLIGDAGYGLIFLGATIFARTKMKKAPGAPLFLMYVLSGATIVWGAMTGTWFGAEKIAELPFFSALIIDNINSFVQGNQDFMIYMCLAIAAVHLSIAHFVVAFRVINTLRAIAEIGWVMIVWGLFFTAGTLLLNKPFPPAGKYLLAAGISSVFLFSNPPKLFLKGLPLTCINLPLKVAGSFADIVSYLRLFAVSSATVILADIINKGAAGMGSKGLFAGLGAAAILFFGHALNIVLGLMAVVVHGIRLNILEFSSHIGMEWTGTEYKPFIQDGG